jgi:tetratricopeptide (TPR) repeat protein
VAVPSASFAGSAGGDEDGDPVTRQIDLLLGKGETLLGLQKPENALACFEEAIALDRNRPEAHVKKATALERLGRIEEALLSYDTAIDLDDTITAAYLGKGSAYNSLERYGEALDCYERALRTHQRTRST